MLRLCFIEYSKFLSVMAKLNIGVNRLILVLFVCAIIAFLSIFNNTFASLYSKLFSKNILMINLE